MNHKSGVFHLLPVLLITGLIIAVLGYFGYQKYLQDCYAVDGCGAWERVLEQNEETDAVVWETYVNDEYGFRLNYPSKYFIFQKSEIDQPAQDTVFVLHDQPALDDSGMGIFSVNTQELEERIEFSIDALALKDVSRTVEDINSNKVVIVKGVASEFMSGTLFQYAFIEKGGQLYIFQFDGISENSYQENEELFKEIISTFEFTNE